MDIKVSDPNSNKITMVKYGKIPIIIIIKTIDVYFSTVNAA